MAEEEQGYKILEEVASEYRAERHKHNWRNCAPDRGSNKYKGSGWLKPGRDGDRAMSDTIGRAIAKSCGICRHCENLDFIVNEKQNHWKIVGRRVTSSDSYVNKIDLLAFYGRDRVGDGRPWRRLFP